MTLTYPKFKREIERDRFYKEQKGCRKDVVKLVVDNVKDKK